ncbi:MAG: transposase [Nitrososphaera sp.]
MPRKPRMYLAGQPCHVVQRGNNRCATFFDDVDYRHYVGCLKEATGCYRVSLHAYVLITNHVHLLMTPSDEFGVSRVMQSLGRRYVQYINHQFRRTGTLWEGRHKASLVQAEHYLLTCYRYIELNPVRAGMVSHPGEYRWSTLARLRRASPGHSRSRAL